jgi:predicted Zn-dependent protease
MHRELRRVVGVMTLGILGLAMGGCVTNAATGRSQLNVLSREEEVSIGEQSMPALIKEYGGVVPDPALRQYVADVGRSLLPHIEEDYKDLPWEFTLLNSKVINAFALPGGKVFMSRGLLEEMTNEAQLAGVLGHEIAHVTAEHADKHIARATGLQIGAAVVSIFASEAGAAASAAADVLVSGAGTFALKFGRDEEIEADTLGMRYMAAQGFNPIGQLQVMMILKEASGGSAPPEWLSTHPAPQTRIDKIQKMLDGKYANTQNNPEYVLNEERFRTECLARLARLPKAQAIVPTDPAIIAMVAAAREAQGCSSACCGGHSAGTH